MTRIVLSIIALVVASSSDVVIAQLKLPHQKIEAIVELPHAYASRYPLLMDNDPFIPPLERHYSFDQRFLDLWIEALDGQEQDRRQLAAETILDAHRRGIDELDRAINPLIAAFRNSEPMLTKQATAAALVELDAQQAADCFVGHASQARLPVARVIEPALARWQDTRLESIWLSRLSDSYTDRARKRLAIECLGILKAESAIPDLTRMVKMRYGASTVRLDCAASLSSIADQRNPEASQFLVSRAANSPLDRILAARLLESSEGEDAIALLSQLCGDTNTSVVSIAAKRLLEISPTAAHSLSHRLIQSPHANVRLTGIRALAIAPDEADIKRLVTMLSDQDPQIRETTRQLLTGHAQAELTPLIRQQFITILNDANINDDWRQLEQAIIFLVENKLKTDAILLPRLLESKRTRVYLTAAWALKESANEKTFAQCLDYVARKYAAINYNPASNESPALLAFNEDQQITHLCEMFGINKYQEAAARLKEFIPKSQRFRGKSAREAATWALGHIYLGRPQTKLARSMAERMLDTNPLDPEIPMMQGMCAVAIARMGNRDLLQSVERFEAGIDTAAGYCKAWALEKLDGKPIPERMVISRRHQNWFLEPVGNAANEK